MFESNAKSLMKLFSHVYVQAGQPEKGKSALQAARWDNCLPNFIVFIFFTPGQQANTKKHPVDNVKMSQDGVKWITCSF